MPNGVGANPWRVAENQTPRAGISIRTGVSLFRGRSPAEAASRASGPQFPAPRARSGGVHGRPRRSETLPGQGYGLKSSVPWSAESPTGPGIPATADTLTGGDEEYDTGDET